MVRILINIWIVVYLSLSALVLLPRSLPRDRLLGPVYKWWSGLGLSQGFAVFVPYVPEENAILVANIEFADGTATQWHFPRMELMAPLERVAGERWRKWWQDILILDYYAVLRPDAARYVARLFQDESNPPVRVSLVAISLPIAPPQRDGRAGASRTRLLYVHPVEKDDLL